MHGQLSRPEEGEPMCCPQKTEQSGGAPAPEQGAVENEAVDAGSICAGPALKGIRQPLEVLAPELPL